MTDRYILQRIYNSITGNKTAWIFFRICNHIDIDYHPCVLYWFRVYMIKKCSFDPNEPIPFRGRLATSPDGSLRARKLWLYLQILKQNKSCEK